MSKGLEREVCPWELRDIDDREELQDGVEGHGEGGVAINTLSDLFQRGLSVLESKLESFMWVAEDDIDMWGGCGGRLSSCFSG